MIYLGKYYLQAIKTDCYFVLLQMSDQTTEGGFTDAERSTVSNTTTANVPAHPVIHHTLISSPLYEINWSLSSHLL